jgi:hypothetical protein
MLEIFLFGYLKVFSGSINAFIYKSNGPIKRRDDDNEIAIFFLFGLPCCEYP